VHKYHGLPTKILTDRDSRFTGKFMTALCELLGTRQSLSTSFHPQTDGQTERMNRVLEDMLRHYVSPYHDDWDVKLAAAEFAVNNAWQDSIQNTPFFLNYGQHPFTPITLAINNRVPQAYKYAQNLQDRIKHAKACLQAAQDRQKAYADRHRREVTFKVGDQVLLSTRNIKLKNPGTKKLMPKYIGPFPITKLIGKSDASGFIAHPVSVRLALPAPMRIHPVFHVSLIKPYKSDGTVQPPTPLHFDSDGSAVWEVDKLLDVRQRKVGRKTVTEYLVSWAGFGPEHHSWEPSTNIVDKALISAFRSARTSAASRSARTHPT
jgi:Chromo (CHRromatin Organisation MOdifier) domain